MKLPERELRIRHRQALACICGHTGAKHQPEACAVCDCKYFRRAAYQPAELPLWRRIPGALAYGVDSSTQLPPGLSQARLKGATNVSHREEGQQEAI